MRVKTADGKTDKPVSKEVGGRFWGVPPKKKQTGPDAAFAGYKPDAHSDELRDLKQSIRSRIRLVVVRFGSGSGGVCIRSSELLAQRSILEMLPSHGFPAEDEDVSKTVTALQKRAST